MMHKEITPIGTRIIVEEIKNKEFEKNANGIIIQNKEEDFNKFSRVLLISVSKECEKFTKEDIGRVLLISTYAGAQFSNDNSNLKIVDESEVYAIENK